MFFDADSHIDECEETWSYIPKEWKHLTPVTATIDPSIAPSWLVAEGSSSQHNRMWFIDGQVYTHRMRSDEITGTTLATRCLYDIPARLADMDALGVDIHVLYPTEFLSELSLRPELEVVLCQSYNRWLADKCAESNGRLRFVAMIPYISMPDALAEMRWAKANGACGIFKRGVECRQLAAGDPYFNPVYALASELDLAICIHTGSGWRVVNDHLSPFEAPRGFEGLQAFMSLVNNKVPQRFPDLRVGFVEFGSDWLPYLLRISGADSHTRATNPGTATLADLRFYVTCEVTEDTAYVISRAGDDNLMIGSDYSHADRAAVKDAHQRFMDRSDISKESAEKITSINGRRFYGID